MKQNLETILSILLGVVGLLFGTDETVLRVVHAFLIMIAFDILTGAIKSHFNKNVTSQKWIDGFIRKIMMILCVSFCYFLDKFQILNIGVSLESASAMFFLVGEVISILENFVGMGVKLPPVLVDYLDKSQGGETLGK